MDSFNGDATYAKTVIRETQALIDEEQKDELKLIQQIVQSLEHPKTPKTPLLSENEVRALLAQRDQESLDNTILITWILLYFKYYYVRILEMWQRNKRF